MFKKLIACILVIAALFCFTACKIEFVNNGDIPSDDFVSDEVSDSSTVSDQSQDVAQTSSEGVSSDQASSGNGESSKQEPSSSAVVPPPVPPEQAVVDKNVVKSCYLLIDCSTINNNLDKFNKNKLSIVPKDGIIYKERKVVFNEGETAFDVLLRETRKNRIHMEFTGSPLYNSNYIEGIANIYEFDCGDLSGWMYNVNDQYPGYGLSQYKLSDGDRIKLKYTCDLGKDLGNEYRK